MRGRAGGKDELLKLWNRAEAKPLVFPFRQNGKPGSAGFALHNATDYDQWAKATETYAIAWEPALQPGYEPWGIMYRRELLSPCLLPPQC